MQGGGDSPPAICGKRDDIIAERERESHHSLTPFQVHRDQIRRNVTDTWRFVSGFWLLGFWIFGFEGSHAMELQGRLTNYPVCMLVCTKYHIKRDFDHSMTMHTDSFFFFFFFFSFFFPFITLLSFMPFLTQLQRSLPCHIFFDFLL